MNQLIYNTGAMRAPHTRASQPHEQKIFGLAFAIAMEAGIIYALLISLGVAPRPAFIPPPLTIVDVKTPEVDHTVPPPPPPTFDAPVITQPVEPIIDLQYVPPVQEHAITLPPPPPDQVAVVTPPPVVTFSPAHAILATHTTPDYPAISRRLGEQGTLRLRLSITADGAVKDAMVEQSSGSQRLDDAAVQWVKAHWRYQPALEGKRAVASTQTAQVTFKLQ